MPKPATGHLRKHARGYSARVRIGTGNRISFELFARTQEAAEQRAALLADLAQRLRGVVSADETEILLAQAGKARTDEALAQVKAAAEAIVNGETTKAASATAPTFEVFAQGWTSGELHRKHPDHVREKDPARDKELLRLHINPVIGPTRIADVGLDACERVMSRLDANLAPATRRHVAQCMRKVLSLAVYPGRYLAANPIPREWMPKVPKIATRRPN